MHLRRTLKNGSRSWLMLTIGAIIAASSIGCSQAGSVDSKSAKRELCSAVPRDWPVDTDEDGSVDKLLTDERDWQKHIDACYALLQSNSPDPNLYYYAGRLELMEANPQRARENFRKGARAGSVKAMTAFGYYQGSFDKDYQAMLEWYHKAAEQGDPMAQTALGLAYTNLAFEWADGVDFNHERGMKHFRAAAEQGDPLAHLMLGAILWPDDETDDEAVKRSMRHYRVAAKRGLPEAQHEFRKAGKSVPDVELDSRWPPTATLPSRIMRRP